MKLHHATPCSECPWRKAAPQGWLGGFEPEQYADPVANNEVTACHNRDFGPDDDETAFCAGALATMSNACISAWKSEGADDSKKLVGKREDCFQHPAMFYEHHSGVSWVHPLLR